jgi:hypothetical protein
MDLHSLSEDETELDLSSEQRTIRTREDILQEGLQIPDVDILALSEEDFPNPTSEATAYRLALSLGVLNANLSKIYAQLLDGGQSSVLVFDKLKALRRTLLRLLVNPSSYIETDRTEDFDGYRNHISLEHVVFCTLLECVSCIVADPRMTELLHYKPSLFPELRAKNLIVENIAERPFSAFRTADVFFSLKMLEQQWTTLKYDASLGRYLDCLLARIAILYRTPTKTKIVGNLENYQRLYDDEYYVPSMDMLQDCCWSLVPMYRKVYLYETLPVVPVPEQYRLSKSTRRAIREIFIENALLMTNNALLEDFRALYMKCSERPSERKKFLRAYNKDPLTENIWKKIRGKAFLRTYLVELNKAPWILAREEESIFKRCERDLLIMLMTHSYISNRSGVDFRKSFVVLQSEFSPTHALLRVAHPILLQAFNHFGVYHKGKFCAHDSFASSLWHWYDIVRGPPFYKQFEHKIIELGDLYQAVMK